MSKFPSPLSWFLIYMEVKLKMNPTFKPHLALHMRPCDLRDIVSCAVKDISTYSFPCIVLTYYI